MLKLMFNVSAEEDSGMKTVSMLEFRSEAEAILKQVGRGQAFVLTYRGKPIARLEPIAEPEIRDDDAIYRLASLASPEAKALTNQEMDRLIYGS